MKRREFVKAGFVAALSVGTTVCAEGAAPEQRVRVIDAHCHAGPGLNFGNENPNRDPWTTFNDPQWTLRRMEEAGIDQTIIFPISNTSYEKANEEIATYVRKWPDQFIGFAKHEAKTEQGKIRELLRHEVNDLGLSGLKLHGELYKIKLLILAPEKEALVLGGNILRLLKR